MNTFIKLQAIAIFVFKSPVIKEIKYSINSKYPKYFAFTGNIKNIKNTESGKLNAKAINIEKVR